ncbi:MAG: TolC family protein [Vicinamibacterales bacterium]
MKRFTQIRPRSTRRLTASGLSVRVLVAVLLVMRPTPGQAQSVQAPGEALTLRTALQFASEHYPSIRAALEETAAATAQIRVAESAYLPRLDAVWQVNRATANNVFGQVLPQSVIPSMSGPVLADASGSNVWGSAVGALLSWEPADLGLRAASVREAQANAALSRADEGVMRLAVQAAVGAAFLAVAQADQAVVAAEADVERRDVLARAAHVLADNQLRPGADASRADAERAGARTRAIRAREAAAIARVEFARLLGLSGTAVSVDTTDVTATATEAQPAPASNDEHPSVRARLAAIDLSKARESVLDVSNRPRLLLQSALFARGTGAHTDGVFDGGVSGLTPDRVNWAAGVQVVIPNLFETAALRARRMAAAASTRSVQAQFDESVLAVSAQRQRAAAVLEAARAIAQNTPVQVAAAAQSEQQARARYDAGLGTLTEVAESQNLLAQAEYEDVTARIDVWRALLDQAVARGDVTSLTGSMPAAGGR